MKKEEEIKHLKRENDRMRKDSQMLSHIHLIISSFARDPEDTTYVATLRLLHKYHESQVCLLDRMIDEEEQWQ